MVNWTMKASGQLEPLVALIDNAIREGPVILMDETPVKVLRLERTGKEGQGYMGRSEEERLTGPPSDTNSWLTGGN